MSKKTFLTYKVCNLFFQGLRNKQETEVYFTIVCNPFFEALKNRQISPRHIQSCTNTSFDTALKIFRSTKLKRSTLYHIYYLANFCIFKWKKCSFHVLHNLHCTFCMWRKPQLTLSHMCVLWKESSSPMLLSGSWYFDWRNLCFLFLTIISSGTANEKQNSPTYSNFQQFKVFLARRQSDP